MVQRDPGDEWVELSAYERRQLALIEQSLDEERLPVTSRTGDFVVYPIWLVLTATWVWLALMGLVLGSPILSMLPLVGVAATLGAHLSRRSPRPRGPDD